MEANYTPILQYIRRKLSHVQAKTQSENFIIRVA
jgi:hypothetical protein